MINLAYLRNQTPSTRDWVHFNNAGASPMPEPVKRAVTDHLQLECDVGGYEAARQAASRIDRFHGALAELLNAAPSEIAFAENATRAWDMAVYGLRLSEGDRILTHVAEYASNYLALLQIAERRGIEIDLVPSDDEGQIDLDVLPALIGPRTRAIVLTHAPTQGGLVNPAEEVGQIAREHGLLYVLDACQSVGQMAVDVERIGCDVLSGTGRKFLRGPRGTGFLYVRKSAWERVEPAFIDLWAAEWTASNNYRFADGARRFESFERNVAGQIGLATAVDYALSIGIEKIEPRVTALAARLRSALAEVSGVTVHDRGRRKSGIVTFSVEGLSADTVASGLRERGILVSVSLRPYALLDFDERGLSSLVRASLHCFNTDEEIERSCAALREIAG